MQNEIVIEADTIEQVRQIAASQVVKGFKISSEKIITLGIPESIQGEGLTSKEAFIKLQKKVPQKAVVLSREELRQSIHRTIEIEAFKEETALKVATSNIRDYNNIEGIQLFKEGNKGFLSFGKKPNLYHVTVSENALVKITYKEKAKALFTYSLKNLMDAINDGDTIEEIGVLLDSETSVDRRDNRGQTPLMVAAWRGHTEIIKFLLSNKADVNARDSGGTTPLMLSHHEEVVKLLISSGADVNIATSWGSTALSDAAKEGKDKIVELLLAHGADVNHSEYDGYTALSRAAMNGHSQVVSILLFNGADVNKMTKHGHTAFTLAMDNNYTEIATIIQNHQPGEKKKVARITKSAENWDTFFLQLSEQEMKGTILPPQLVLCCQDVSMATRLAKGLPETTRFLQSSQTEVLEFGDGHAAARFPLKDGKDILQFISLLGQGNYGTERLVIKNGIALRLPVSDRQLLRQSLSISQVLSIGTAEQAGQETFIWW